MIDLTSYLYGIQYSTFKYWFVRNSINTFSVERLSDNAIVGRVFIDSKFGPVVDVLPEFNGEDGGDIIRKEIEKYFSRYTRRPEFTVGCLTLLNNNESNIDSYERVLIGCILVRSRRMNKNKSFDPDDSVGQAHRAIEWLRTTDFYSAPASTRFHESFNGGLLQHTLNVAIMASQISWLPKFHDAGVNLDEAVLCCLVHDWCKIGFYESYMRNVKDDSGKWVQKSEFKSRDKSLTSLGHGVSSMFLAQKFFRLSTEECLAIRWHMGPWRVVDSEMNELQQSNETYPLVHLVQFSDQLSIVNY